MNKKHKATNIEFSPAGKRNLAALCRFTGWTMKRVIERALELANKNRGGFWPITKGE